MEGKEEVSFKLMDDEKFECKWFNKPILLTKREYIILKSLAGRPRVVFTRQQLLEQINFILFL